jgi:hypothetical protein
MNVQDLAAIPVIEQVLAMRFDPLQTGAVELFGAVLETALGRQHVQRLPAESLPVVAGDAVDRVTFGHAPS